MVNGSGRGEVSLFMSFGTLGSPHPQLCELLELLVVGNWNETWFGHCALVSSVFRRESRMGFLSLAQKDRVC